MKKMMTMKIFGQPPAGEKAGGSFIMRYRHLLLSAVGWAAFLFLFFLLKTAIKPIYFIHSPLDELIPFVKWALFPYSMWYVYLVVVQLYLGLTSRADFVRLQAYLFTGMGICLFFYTVYPNAVAFRPVIVQKDVVSRMVASLYKVDSSAMVTPSMHVFDAIALHVALVKNEATSHNRLLLASSFVIVVLICASTVLLKQHSVIDVLWGVVLAAALYFPVYRRQARQALLEIRQK